MELKEFTEYTNPLEQDYDITSSLKASMEQEEANDREIEEKNKIYYELSCLIGILEDEEFDNVEELYGITQKEYLNPTKETIKKVQEYLGIKQKSR